METLSRWSAFAPLRGSNTGMARAKKRGEQDGGGKKGKKMEKAEKARRPATKQQCIGTEAEACFQ